MEADMKTSRFVEDIGEAVRSGRLKEPFRALDVKRACLGWAEKTYSVFLPKHRKENPSSNKEYFIQHPDGSYSLLEH